VGLRHFSTKDAGKLVDDSVAVGFITSHCRHLAIVIMIILKQKIDNFALPAFSSHCRDRTVIISLSPCHSRRNCHR